MRDRAIFRLGYHRGLRAGEVGLLQLASYRKAADLGEGCGPGDLRQSSDDRYMYVSCTGRGEVQAWDITDPEHPRLHDTVQGIVQANMMHVTWDNRRLYVTNSAISSIDFSPRYMMRLIYIGPDGP